MKQRSFSDDVSGMIGQEVSISGWVQSRRDHGGVIFVDVRDHTGLVQLVINPEHKWHRERARRRFGKSKYFQWLC